MLLHKLPGVIFSLWVQTMAVQTQLIPIEKTNQHTQQNRGHCFSRQSRPLYPGLVFFVMINE